MVGVLKHYVVCVSMCTELRPSPSFRVVPVDSESLSVGLVDDSRFRYFRVFYRHVGQPHTSLDLPLD